MVRSQNLFREYFIWRSRMALYAAVALTFLLVAGLVAWFAGSPENINRFGLLLQFLGVLAVAPVVIGKENFSFLRQQVAPGEITGGNEPAPADGPPRFGAPGYTEIQDDGEFLAFYEANNLTFLLGNILASAALIWLWVDAVIAPRPDYFLGEGIWRVMFSILGFNWLNLFMLLLIFRLSGSPVSRGMLAWFFTVDFFVSIPGIIFAGLIHILLYWVIGGVRFVFHNGPRRVLLIVTLPFLVAGLFFELIATF